MRWGVLVPFALFGMGCVHDDVAVQPQLALNQEFTVMGEYEGVKSFGPSKNVSIYPTRQQDGAMDLLVVAENHHGAPVYFGRKDIQILNRKGEPLEMPELVLLQTELRAEAEAEAERLVRADRISSGAWVPLNGANVSPSERMRKQATGNHSLSSNDIHTWSGGKTENRLKSKLEHLQAVYTERMKALEESWLEEGYIGPGEFYQGVVRARLPEDPVDGIVLEIKTGEEFHRIELAMR